MLSKTLALATLVAAVAAQNSTYSLPTCWSSCFAQYDVDSEGCLCSDSLGTVVSSCIQGGCDSADNAAYQGWLASYCASSAPATATNTWSSPSAYTVPASYVSPTGSYGTYTVPASATTTAPGVWTPGAPTSPATGAPGAPGGAPYPTGSVCLSTTTMIWRSSSSVMTFTATEPASGWPSGTGAAVPSGYPVPATGGASGLKSAGVAGLAVFVGAAALLL